MFGIKKTFLYLGIVKPINRQMEDLIKEKIKQLEWSEDYHERELALVRIELEALRNYGTQN
jgi:hypothetical protein